MELLIIKSWGFLLEKYIYVYIYISTFIFLDPYYSIINGFAFISFYNSYSWIPATYCCYQGSTDRVNK